jgi:hypothetical protein
MGMHGYLLMNLQSALEFIKSIGPESVTMNAVDFMREMEKAEQILDV